MPPAQLVTLNGTVEVAKYLSHLNMAPWPPQMHP